MQAYLLSLLLLSPPIPYLELSGTAQERGIRHGEALGLQIKDLIENYILERLDKRRYEMARRIFGESAQIPATIREEAQGIVDGMKRSQSAYSSKLRREFDLDDLLLVNSYTDLVSVGCSSVSAWGEASEGAAPLLVRNLDWELDPALLRNQQVFLHRSKEGQALLSVAFAGYIGCLSCISASGVGIFFNMGHGQGSASWPELLKGFAPANLILRWALEQGDQDGDGRQSLEEVAQLIEKQSYAGSYIVHLLDPQPRADGSHALVLELEARGKARRTAQADPKLGPWILAASNHLRILEVPRPGHRYRHIQDVESQRLKPYNPSALWRLGEQIRLSKTMQSMLYHGDELRLELRWPDEERRKGRFGLQALFKGPPGDASASPSRRR